MIESLVVIAVSYIYSYTDETPNQSEKHFFDVQ